MRWRERERHCDNNHGDINQLKEKKKIENDLHDEKFKNFNRRSLWTVMDELRKEEKRGDGWR